LNPSENEIRFHCDESFKDIYSMIFTLLLGSTFSLSQTAIPSNIAVMREIGFSAGIQIISSQIPIPTSLEESLEIIQIDPSLLHEKQFRPALTLLSSNFFKIEFPSLSSLPPSILHEIFSCPTLRVRTENEFCQVIEQLISINEGNKILLSDLDFRFLCVESVRRVLSRIEAEDIDSDLFEALKQRLFCSVHVESEDIPKQRYTESPNVHTSEEHHSVFRLVESFFKSREDLSSKLETHFSEHERMKSELAKAAEKKVYVPFSTTSKEEFFHHFLVNSLSLLLQFSLLVHLILLKMFLIGQKLFGNHPTNQTIGFLFSFQSTKFPFLDTESNSTLVSMF
jgi:hypothetical protein